jgi:hypothetical protein
MHKFINGAQIVETQLRQLVKKAALSKRESLRKHTEKEK